jgi:hypothetical protein
MVSHFAMLSKAVLCIFILAQLVAAVSQADRSKMMSSTPEDHVLAKRVLSMTLWDPKKGDNPRDIFYGLETTNSDRRNHPTFYKKQPVSSFETAAQIARQAYNDIKDKVRNRPTKLVAVLRVPSGSGKGDYISTIPDGPGLGYLKRNKELAPAWNNAMGTRNVDVLHAEDGAEMLYEMENPETNTDFTYPAGTTMAVYGTINNNAVGPQQPCSQPANGAPVPTCATVMAALNIT